MAKKTTAKSNVNQDPTVNLKVYVKLSPEAQEVFNHQRRDQAVSFPAVVATTAKMAKDSGNGIVGVIEDDKYVVTLDVDQLTTVFEAAREYQKDRPADISAAKAAVVYAENAISFARSNNSGIDLSEAELRLNSARTELKRLVFSKESNDFRPVVEMADLATTTAKTAVVEHLKVRAAGLAKETGTLEEFADVLDNLSEDLDQARKNLVGYIKDARELRMPPARPTTTSKPSDGRLREKVGTSLGRTGGYSGGRR